MDVVRSARNLAEFVSDLPDFEIVSRNGPVYRHMGAITSDAILQAGVSYRTVVVPRVRRILEEYSDASTLSAFWVALSTDGPEHVLRWSHPEKPRRLVTLVNFLLCREIETANDLRAWLCLAPSATELYALKGIGPKTVDYISGLVGIHTVAVDRHIMRMLEVAGVGSSDYEVAKRIVIYASAFIGVSPGDLDHSIWLYFSSSRFRQRKFDLS